MIAEAFSAILSMLVSLQSHGHPKNKVLLRFLLAQMPITLALMMINSYSYSTNDLVFIKFEIFNQDFSWCLAS